MLTAACATAFERRLRSGGGGCLGQHRGGTLLQPATPSQCPAPTVTERRVRPFEWTLKRPCSVSWAGACTTTNSFPVGAGSLIWRSPPPPHPGMHWKWEVPPTPPRSRAPSLRPATVSLTPSASLNGICTESNRPQPLRQPPPTACLTASAPPLARAVECRWCVRFGRVLRLVVPSFCLLPGNAPVPPPNYVMYPTKKTNKVRRVPTSDTRRCGMRRARPVSRGLHFRGKGPERRHGAEARGHCERRTGRRPAPPPVPEPNRTGALRAADAVGLFVGCPFEIRACGSSESSDWRLTVGDQGCPEEPHFCFVKDSPQGPPTANRQPPPTATHCSVVLLWSCVLPMSWP